jgi:N-acetylneuraminic acid mutarotase
MWSRRGVRPAVLVAYLLVFAAACLPDRSGVSAVELLRDRFPIESARVLPRTGEERFGAAVGDPESAAWAALERREGLRLRPPASADQPFTLTLPGGTEVTLREGGARGPVSDEGGVLSYARAQGHSFWRPIDRGYEEWLLITTGDPELPAAQWEVSGGALRARGDGAVELSVEGASRVTIRADAAFDRAGERVAVKLSVEDGLLTLRLPEVARGEQVLVDPAFIASGSLVNKRSGHTATLLLDGTVLIAGGARGSQSFVYSPMASCERYDPARGTFSSAGSMILARYEHTAVLLTSGKVLVAGGFSSNSYNSSTNGAELFDPVASTWSSAGTFTGGRADHLAVRLADGRVLIAGGWSSLNSWSSALDTAQIYSPNAGAGTWASAGTMTSRRAYGAAALLPNGKVLIAGGAKSSTESALVAEVFDPAAPVASAFSPSGTMTTGRIRFALVLLRDGNALALGGQADNGAFLASVERWANGSWTAVAPLSSAREYPMVALTPDNKLMVMTGDNDAGVVASAELYLPTGSQEQHLITPRVYATALYLPSGQLFLAGGNSNINGTNDLVSTELVEPRSATWTTGAQLGAAREAATATLLANGRVLVVGGKDPVSGAARASAELYDPEANSWSAAGSLLAARHDHRALLLPTGKVLVTGGWDGAALASSELYDPQLNQWVPTGALATAMRPGPLVLLSNGRAMRVGGETALSGGVPALSCELYDPVTGRWTATGALNATRAQFSVTVLLDGRLMALGGVSGANYLGAMELYNPAIGAWSNAASSGIARAGHTATLLRDGRVVVAGGANASGALASVDVYNPSGDSWASLAALPSARSQHSALLLPNGRVLVSGGDGVSTAVVPPAVFHPENNSWETIGAPSVERWSHPMLLLPRGKVMLVAGRVPAGSARAVDLLDPKVAPVWRPVLNAPASPVTPGQTLTLAGSQLTDLTEASGGTTNATSTSYPVVLARRAESGGEWVLPGSSFSASTSTVTVPASMIDGHYWMRAVVSGSPSVEVPLLVSSAVNALKYPGATCANAAECGTGFCNDGVCCDGACTGTCDACSVAAGAAFDGVCAPKPNQTSCSNGLYCDGAEVCVAGTCTAGAAACPVGSTCIEAGQVCALPVMDAGVPDAGSVDAGELDAGVIDAGLLDAGVIDAGLLDAGVIDAGLLDAGVIDAGLIDAGLVDAGLLDAGVIDAGVIDAGLVDAGPGDAGFLDAGGGDAGLSFPDPGDAGAALDAGVDPDAGTSTDPRPNPLLVSDLRFGTGCGCGSAGFDPAYLALALIALVRRQRR